MRTVYLDVDTQLDFVLPAGALYVPGAERLLPFIARLNRAALREGHTLLSTADAHTENDPEFRMWPPHCLIDSIGQRKHSGTLVGQDIVRKRTTDCFFETNLTERLNVLAPERYVIYGLVTEICVRQALDGALRRGGRVELVRDAILGLDEKAASETVAHFTAQGGCLTTTSVLTG